MDIVTVSEAVAVPVLAVIAAIRPSACPSPLGAVAIVAVQGIPVSQERITSPRRCRQVEELVAELIRSTCAPIAAQPNNISMRVFQWDYHMITEHLGWEHPT